MSEFDPYEILGLKKGCSNKDIKNALRNLSKKHHPDVGGDPEVFIQINIAVQLLRDPYRRGLYDDFGIHIEVSQEQIEKMVIVKFTELATRWIDWQIQNNQSIAVNKFFDDNIRAAQAQGEMKCNELKNVISNLKIRRAQVTVSDGENIIQKLMDDRIQNIKSNITQLEQDRFILGKIKELSLKYSSEEIMQYVSIGSSSRTSTGPTMFYRGY